MTDYASHKKLELPSDSLPRLVAVIGDIHGESARLRQVLDFIKQKSDETNRKPFVVFLGDYVDRGPDSKGAVDLVMRTLDEYPDSIAIRGNHDYRFGKWAERVPNRQQMSALTLKSFGIRDARAANKKDKQAERRGKPKDINLNNIAPEYREFLSDGLTDVFELQCGAGRFAFVHGGIDWRLPLHEQDEKFILFGNSENFWNPDTRHADYSDLTRLFFGHWILRQPKIWNDGRIGLDTGCSTGGELSFALFDSGNPDGELTFHSTGGNGIEPMHYAVEEIDWKYDRDRTAGTPVSDRINIKRDI